MSVSLKSRRVLPGALSLAFAAPLLLTVPATAASAGFYASSQADAGHQLFNNHCAECHRPDLTGAMGPALVGKPFKQHWGGKSVEALYQFEHDKMPATNPGSLPEKDVMAITAYILQRNGLPAGGQLDATSAPKLTIPSPGT